MAILTFQDESAIRIILEAAGKILIAADESAQQTQRVLEYSRLTIKRTKQTLLACNTDVLASFGRNGW